MIKGTVEKLIKKHKTNNPFEIAEQKNIIVIHENLGDTLGFYNRYKRIKFIHINNKIDEKIKKFVCAHELGHAILHHDANTPFLKKKTLFLTDKIEVEANTFAVELLMPDSIIYELKDTNLTIYDTAQLYGVPEEVSHLKVLEKNL